MTYEDNVRDVHPETGEIITTDGEALSPHEYAEKFGRSAVTLSEDAARIEKTDDETKS